MGKRFVVDIGRKEWRVALLMEVVHGNEADIAFG
jgi:hypothetical protein